MNNFNIDELMQEDMLGDDPSSELDGNYSYDEIISIGKLYLKGIKHRVYKDYVDQGSGSDDTFYNFGCEIIKILKDLDAHELADKIESNVNNLRK